MPKDEKRRSAAPRPAGPAPSTASLRETALAHLARFAATEVGLKRVLERRVDRWARRAEQDDPSAREAIGAAAAAAKRPMPFSTPETSAVRQISNR